MMIYRSLHTFALLFAASCSTWEVATATQGAGWDGSDGGSGSGSSSVNPCQPGEVPYPISELSEEDRIRNAPIPAGDFICLTYGTGEGEVEELDVPDPGPPPMDPTITEEARASCDIATPTPLPDPHCDDHIVDQECRPVPLPRPGTTTRVQAALDPKKTYYSSRFEKFRAPLKKRVKIFEHSATRVTRYRHDYNCVTDTWVQTVDAGPTGHPNHGRGPGDSTMKRYYVDYSPWGGLTSSGFRGYSNTVNEYCPCNEGGAHTQVTNTCYGVVFDWIAASPVSHPLAHVCNTDTHHQQRKWREALGQPVEPSKCGDGINGQGRAP